MAVAELPRPAVSGLERDERPFSQPGGETPAMASLQSQGQQGGTCVHTTPSQQNPHRCSCTHMQTTDSRSRAGDHVLSTGSLHALTKHTWETQMEKLGRRASAPCKKAAPPQGGDRGQRPRLPP